jgi:hypothetical protein
VSSLRQVIADLVALGTSSESAVEDYKLARRKEINARIEVDFPQTHSMERTDILQHTNNCWLWLEAYLDDRKEDLEQARRRRLLAIEVRVEEDLGYGKELRWLLHSDKSSGLREKLRDDFTGTKAVKQAKDLTDRSQFSFIYCFMVLNGCSVEQHARRYPHVLQRDQTHPSKQNMFVLALALKRCLLDSLGTV